MCKMREWKRTVILLLLCPGAYGSMIEDWDLWPLITPVLGDLSEECKSASEEYIRLLNETMHQTNTKLTEKHLNAMRRFDSNGPILQEGMFGDVIEVNICDTLGGPEFSKWCKDDILPTNICEVLDGRNFTKLCKNHFPNGGLFPIPVGTFTSPGLERVCKRLEHSKYCTNHFTLLNGGNSNDNNMNFSSVLSKTFPLEIYEKDDDLSSTLDLDPKTLDLDPKTIFRISNILIDKRGPARGMIRYLKEIIPKSKLFEINDDEEYLNVIKTCLLSLWIYHNSHFGLNNNLDRPLIPFQGVCYPSLCSKEEIHENNVLFAKHIGIPFALTPGTNFYEKGCTDDDKYRGDWKIENYVVFIMLSVIAFFILIGTIVDIFTRKNVDAQLEQGIGLQILISFSLISNMEYVFKSSQCKEENRLGCLDGMRVFSMSWVILSHTFLYGQQFLQLRNFEYTDRLRNGRDGGMAFEVIKQGYLAVATFFFIGATLLTFLLLKDLDKTNGWFYSRGPVRIFLLFLNRYLRISIPYGLVIALCTGFTPMFITEPSELAILTLREANHCKQYWWTNLLYINLWKGEYDCIGQTWYLSFDMEWFLVAPIMIIYPMWMWRKKALTGQPIFGILAISWWFLLYLTFVLIQFVYYLFIQDEIIEFSQYHQLPTWLSAPWGVYSIPYLQGILTGYILYVTEGKTIRLQWKINILMWVLIFFLALFGVYFHGVDNYYRYYFNHCLWGFCLGWVIFACVKGYGGPVNHFLSWNLWKPIAKISYMTFLLHMQLEVVYSLMQDYVVDYSMWMLTETFVAQLIIDLVIGLLGCLALELPFFNIQILLFEGK